MTHQKPRRLLWVFPTFAAGGSQRRMLTLLPHLKDAEHHLIALDGCLDALTLLPPTVDINVHAATLQRGGGVSLSNVLRFVRFLYAVRPHTLITHNWGTIEWHLASRLHGCKHVHIEDGFGPDEIAGPLPRRTQFRRLAFRGWRKAFIAPSVVLQRRLRDDWRVPPHRIYHLPNGVDTQAFALPVRRVSDVCTLGTVAALRPEKRIDRLLQVAAAAAEHAPVRVLIVGDGAERARLQAQARDLKLDVEWAGAQTDVRGFLARMDIFLLTSDTEQLPIALLEAMACGLPALATAVGDVPLMLPDQIAHDDADLLHRLLDLIHNRRARAEAGLRNRERVLAYYPIEQMIAGHRHLYGMSRSVTHS